MDDTKELRIDGWIDLYGEIKSDFVELATPGVLDGEPVGKGSYMVRVKLKNSIPHIRPIGGLKVKCTYIGVKKQCKNCYEYHTSKSTEKESRKRSYTCEKRHTNNMFKCLQIHIIDNFVITEEIVLECV